MIALGFAGSSSFSGTSTGVAATLTRHVLIAVEYIQHTLCNKVVYLSY